MVRSSSLQFHSVHDDDTQSQRLWQQHTVTVTTPHTTPHRWLICQFFLVAKASNDNRAEQVALLQRVSLHSGWHCDTDRDTRSITVLSAHSACILTHLGLIAHLVLSKVSNGKRHGHVAVSTLIVWQLDRDYWTATELLRTGVGPFLDWRLPFTLLKWTFIAVNRIQWYLG